MAKTLMIKTLAVAAFVCLLVDLAASRSAAAPATITQPQQDYQQQQQQQEYQQQPIDVGGLVGEQTYEPAVTSTTTAAPHTFKDKLKGFVSSVKEGASDALESVSDTVSGAAHSLDEKRKEAVAGTKKLVNGAIDKIKSKYDSFKNGDKDAANKTPYDPSSPEEVAHVQSVESQESVEKAYITPITQKPEKHL